MRYRFIVLVSFLLIFNSLAAQWHFSASLTSNTNCGNWAAELEIVIYEEVAKNDIENLSKKSYSSREECEKARKECMWNVSNSGCYVKTTVTPCMGNVNSPGSYYEELSSHNAFNNGLYDYFSQGKTHDVYNGMVENDMTVNNEVLNKNFHNAAGINTSDKGYNSKILKDIGDRVKDEDRELKPTEFFYALSMRKTGAYLGDNYYPTYDQIYMPRWDGDCPGYNNVDNPNYLSDMANKDLRSDLYDHAEDIFTMEELWKKGNPNDDIIMARVEWGAFGIKLLKSTAEDGVEGAKSTITGKVYDKLKEVAIDALGGRYAREIETGINHVENVNEFAQAVQDKGFIKAMADAAVSTDPAKMKQVVAYTEHIMNRFARKTTDNFLESFGI